MADHYNIQQGYFFSKFVFNLCAFLILQIQMF